MESLIKITIEEFENKLLIEITQGCVKTTHKVDIPNSGVVLLGELLTGLEVPVLTAEKVGSRK